MEMAYLTLSDLECMVGATLEITENVAERIQYEVQIIAADKALGVYDSNGPYKHLHLIYEAIAAIIVRAETSEDVLELTIPRLVDFFRVANWPQMDSRECQAALRPIINRWHGLKGRMKHESSATSPAQPPPDQTEKTFATTRASNRSGESPLATRSPRSAAEHAEPVHDSRRPVPYPAH